MSDVCDACGDAVKVVTLFAGTAAEHQTYEHVGSRPERGVHAVQVGDRYGPYDPVHTHEWGPWWGPFGGHDSPARYFRGCAGCTVKVWARDVTHGCADDETDGWATQAVIGMDDGFTSIFVAQPGYRQALRSRGYTLVRNDLMAVLGMEVQDG